MSKIRLQRIAYQRYQARIPGVGIVAVERNGNPLACACFRWNAYGDGVHESAFTLKEMRGKLEAAATQKAAGR